MNTTKYSSVNKLSATKSRLRLAIVAAYLIIILITSMAIWTIVNHTRQYNHWRHLKRTSIKTTCIVKQYNFTRKNCLNFDCWICKCYTEQFEVTYQTRKGSQKNGTIITEDVTTPTPIEIGSSDKCWYDPRKYENPVWEIENSDKHRRRTIGFFILLIFLLPCYVVPIIMWYLFDNRL